MFRQQKRGQTPPPSFGGTNAATFIAILGGLILLYILFLPPGEREALLADTDTDVGGDPSPGIERVLLEETPGKLDSIGFTEFQHRIASFTIFSVQEPKELISFQLLQIKNNWFSKEPKAFSFTVEDVSLTTKLLLSFSVPEHEGDLSILFNGEEVFFGEILTENIEPISLPKKLIAEENEITFEVSNTGWSFWRSNFYILENVKVIADIKDISRQSSQSTFVLTENENNNVERTTLRFFPECNPIRAGLLKVYVNNNLIFSGVPDCGILNRYEFAPEHVKEGENTLIMVTEEGSYLIDQINVVTKLEKPDYPTYYFVIDPIVFDAVRSRSVLANLDIEFVDDGEIHRALLTINGFKTEARTDGAFYSRIINDFLITGNNYIQVTPETDINIARMRVVLT